VGPSLRPGGSRRLQRLAVRPRSSIEAPNLAARADTADVAHFPGTVLRLFSAGTPRWFDLDQDAGPFCVCVVVPWCLLAPIQGCSFLTVPASLQHSRNCDSH
jgi:hypothetical protein